MKREGKKSVRSVVVSVRLDPRLFYLGTRIAKKRRQSLSSYIEESLERAAYAEQVTTLDDYTKNERITTSGKELLQKTWASHETERLLKLWEQFPELLDSDEHDLFELLERIPELWERKSGKKVLKVELVEDRLDYLKRVAVGDQELDISELKGKKA